MGGRFSGDNGVSHRGQAIGQTGGAQNPKGPHTQPIGRILAGKSYIH